MGGRSNVRRIATKSGSWAPLFDPLIRLAVESLPGPHSFARRPFVLAEVDALAYPQRVAEGSNDRVVGLRARTSRPVSALRGRRQGLVQVPSRTRRKLARPTVTVSTRPSAVGAAGREAPCARRWSRVLS